MSTPATLTGHDRPGDPCTFVIFGASGDLAKRLLLPALYNLKALQLLPKEFALVGVDFKDGDDESFRKQFTEDIHQFATRPVDEATWAEFRKTLFYVQGDFNDDGLYQKVNTQVEQAAKQCKVPGNVLYYLAVAPRFFGLVASKLGDQGYLKENDHWRRLIIEKPFGTNLKSAQELAKTLKTHMTDSQIFPIDHFTGKETVQNIMALRFGNEIFEPLLNRNNVEGIQITAAESLGVEKRGGYYDQSGATRDMLQNHVLSILSLIAMDAPTSLSGEAVRNEKLRVLEALKLFSSPEDMERRAIRGQYGGGMLGGTNCIGYRHEPDVDPNSNTETYSAMELYVDNWRWAGVPFYIRSGKRLPEKLTEVAIHFKSAPLCLFDECMLDKSGPNRLVIKIAPTEGFSFTVEAKIPGPKVKLKRVNMDFDYEEFANRTKATGYETLLYDCMTGEPSLFNRSDIIEASWRMMGPVLDYWAENPAKNFPNYNAGSWGPKASDDMLARKGNAWWTSTGA